MVAGCVIAVGAMELALLQNNFSLAYVAGNSTIETPTIYKIATLWGALEGSLLLWALYFVAMWLLLLGASEPRSMTDLWRGR